MPKIYINSDVSPGGAGTPGDPYASWSEAVTAEAGNFVAPGTYDFYFRGTTPDTVTPEINCTPASGSGDLILNFRPWHTFWGAESDAVDGWYRGAANWSTSHYRLEVDNGASSHCKGVIIAGDANTTDIREVNVQGLQVKVTSSGGACRPFAFNDGVSGVLRLENNRLWNASTGSLPYFIRTGSSPGCIVRWRNNLCLYNGTSNFNPFDINSANIRVEMLCTTFISTSDGGDIFSDFAGNTHKVVGNVLACPEGLSSGSSGTVEIDYNAGQNVSTRGANGFAVDTAGDFTDYGGAADDQNTPAASQTNAWGAGAPTNGDDADVPIYDIRGNARNTGAGENTAIGAFAAEGEGSAGAAEVSGTGLTATGRVAKGSVTARASVVGAALVAIGALGLGGVAAEASAAGAGLTSTGSLASGAVSTEASIAGAGLSAQGRVGQGAVTAEADAGGLGLVASGRLGLGEISIETVIAGRGLVGSGILGQGSIAAAATTAGLGLVASGRVGQGAVVAEANAAGLDLSAQGRLGTGALTTTDDALGLGLITTGQLGTGSVAAEAPISGLGLAAQGRLGQGGVSTASLAAGLGLVSTGRAGLGALVADALADGLGLAARGQLGTGAVTADATVAGVGLLAKGRLAPGSATSADLMPPAHRIIPAPGSAAAGRVIAAPGSAASGRVIPAPFN